MSYCDDSKYPPPKTANSEGGNGDKPRGGKPSPIRGKDITFCHQLDRTKWAQQLPRGHDEDTCHMTSQKRRDILKMMKKLVNEYVDSPVCPEWDTSTTCENTPGPYRFGVLKPNNDNYKIMGSKMTVAGCECMRRNGLQDDCPLPRCRDNPACRETPFPRCEPFLGIPEAPASSRKFAAGQQFGDDCCCPVV